MKFICYLRAAWVSSVLMMIANAGASEPGDRTFNLEEVAPGVFVHQGRQVGINHAARGDSANIGFVVGNSCVAVIDAGGSFATGRALRARIKTQTPTPICFVINTHAHFDHLLGNAAFLVDRPKFVGHANLTAVIAASREYFLDRFAKELAGAPAPHIIAPNLQVAEGEELVLDLGARQLRLVAHPLAHSPADLTVLDVSTNILWAGDLLFVERLPVLDGSLKGWQHWMQQAAPVPYARVIPGHGPLSGWPDAVIPQQRYLDTLQATVTQALKDGDFLEDVVAGAHAAPPDWQVPGAHARNLSKAYRELEWQ